jgi:hypothetical protein
MATDSQELPSQAADAVTGVIVEAAEAVTDPAGTTAKRVRRLERAGAPVNRVLGRQVTQAAGQAVNTTTRLLNGSVTEAIVLRGLRLVKTRAQRRDLVGEAAYRSLEILHGSFGDAARRIARFQEATQPPARANDRRRTRTSARKAAANTASGAQGTARATARRTARRATGQSSRSRRRSA